MNYKAPQADIRFNFQHIADLSRLQKFPAHAELDMETAATVVEEFARFNEELVAPLNAFGDKNPSTWHKDFSVKTTAGFREAYASFCAGGWQSLGHPPEHGGQGFPRTVCTAGLEILNAANLSFALCPLLTDGAIEALALAGSDELKQRYIENMVSGKWAGTMNLTEPQAGSDLAAIRTRAVAQADGSWKLFGTKIFITYGEHDLAENIIHFVLARAEGAPAGIKGLSLFLVPKYLVQPDGSLGERNDVYAVSIEHKLGIKASPTCVLQYGDNGGARAWLVGEENRGLAYMFIMMNAARFGVGVQGIALAERAYQKAAAFAQERVQGKSVDSAAPTNSSIAYHPDVRRMLMFMRASTQACRSMAFAAAYARDVADQSPDAEERQQHKLFYEFLVPLVKGYSTEMALEVASVGVQVHGGMGFIEETGAAQYLRDAKILSIYEGTTAIQANDLIGRKILGDGGETARAILQKIATTEAVLAQGNQDAQLMGAHLTRAREHASAAIRATLQAAQTSNAAASFAGSVPLLMLLGTLIAGWQMARSLLAAQAELAKMPASVAASASSEQRFMQAKIVTATFFATHLLSRSGNFEAAVVAGSASTLALPIEDF